MSERTAKERAEGDNLAWTIAYWDDLRIRRSHPDFFDPAPPALSTADQIALTVKNQQIAAIFDEVRRQRESLEQEEGNT